MKKNKSKIIALGLVTSLMIIGSSAAFVNASRNNLFSDSEFSKPAETIRFELPDNGDSFLEPAPLEEKNIEIYIVNQEKKPVFDAWIHIFKNGNDDFCWEGFTDKNGMTYWPTPNVNIDTKYKILAEKYDDGEYYSSIIFVTIKNRQLIVSLNENSVDEGDNFDVKVTDQDNKLLSLVSVKFNGKIELTNNKGIASFNAPWVDKNTTYLIEASAPLRGYDEGYKIITIIDCGDTKPHKIYGQVRNYDFIPMKQVKIKVITEDSSPVTYTDKNGNYDIWIIPKEGGELVTIKAFCDGYPTQSVKVWVDSKDSDSTYVNFWLVKDGENANQNTNQQSQVVTSCVAADI